MRDSNHSANKTNRILIGVCIFAFGCLWGGLAASEKIFPFEQITYIKNFFFRPPPQQTDQPKPRNSIFQAFSPQVSVVMVGDSLTEAAEWNDIFPEIRIANRGIGGDRADNILSRMEPIFAVNAKKAFLMVGINDIYSGQTINAIFDNYTNIVRQLKNKGTEVYIQSTLECSKSICREKLESVRDLNERLKAYATENHITFININNGLTSQQEGLLNEYTNDGIHLLGKGYIVWSEAIKPYVNSN